MDLSRRKNKTSDEKLIWIDGPTSDEEFRKNGPVKHDIKVVVENYKSEKKKKIDAKVFSTLDWIGGGGVAKAENKLISFKVLLIVYVSIFLKTSIKKKEYTHLSS